VKASIDAEQQLRDCHIGVANGAIESARIDQCGGRAPRSHGPAAL